MNLLEKLSEIQQELKAPKGQYNSFGKYKYRSCEDILTAVKPLCNEHKCVLMLTDELINVCDRYYVKSSAVLKDCESQEIEHANGYAREEESKKGMDGSQITGTASSYARKYALNGLFDIDDTKDADTDAYASQTSAKAKCAICKKEFESSELKLVKAKDGKVYKICSDCYGQAMKVSDHE